MNKREAINLWWTDYLETFREIENGTPDYPMRSESWNNFVDDCISDHILSGRAREWTAPQQCSPKSERDWIQ